MIVTLAPRFDVVKKGFAVRPFLFFILFSLSSSLFAAHELFQRGKFWTDLSIRGTVDDAKKYDYLVRFNLRFAEQESIFEERIVRLGIGTWLSDRHHLQLGIQAKHDVPYNEDRPEHGFRFQQQVTSLWVRNKTFLANWRARLEERRELGKAGWSFRFRERIQFRFFWKNSAGIEPIFREEISLLLNHPDWVSRKTLDQNRVFLGFHKQLSAHWSYQLGYSNQFKIRDPNIMNHIAILSFDYERN